MSAALLRKGLALCDPEFDQVNKGKLRKVKKEKKLKARVTKLDKRQIIQSERKVSINEARKKIQAREQILKDNLARLKLCKKSYSVNLDRDIAQQVIERAVTRKPIKSKPAEETIQKTAFTEEDFKKFEQEYLED